VKNVTIFRVIDIGLNVSNTSDPASPAATANSGPYSNITFDPANLTITGGQTFGAYLNSSTRGIQGMTCTTGNLSSASSTGTCVYVAATGNSVQDVRIEGFSTGVEVSAKNTLLMNIDGDTNPLHTTTVLNVVKIDAGKTDVALIGIANNCTNNCSDGSDTTINDSATGTQILVSTDPFVAMYVLGDTATIGGASAYSRYTTSASPPTTTSSSTANWQVRSGTPSTSSNACTPGSLYSNTSGTGTALYVCSAITGTYQTWQPVQ
jgi:hypothetical protein